MNMFGEETGLETDREMERLGSKTGDGRGWVTIAKYYSAEWHDRLER